MKQLDRAMEGLGLFYRRRQRLQEGQATFQEAAERLSAAVQQLPGTGRRPAPISPGRTLAKILAWQSEFSRQLGRKEYAHKLLQRGLALLHEPHLADQDTRGEKAFILSRMGRLETDREQARRLLECSLALYRALGSQWWTADTLYMLGMRARQAGDFGEAIQRLEEGASIYRALGDQAGLAKSTWNLGLLYVYQGQVGVGERLGRESLATFRKLGGRLDIGRGLFYQGYTLVHVGKYVESHSLLVEGEAIANDLGRRRHLATWIFARGWADLHLGRYDSARAYGHLALALAREFDQRSSINFALQVLGCVALAREAYAEAQCRLQEGVDVYRAIKLQGWRGDILAMVAYAARGLGNLDQAQAHLYEALQTARDIQAAHPLLLVLPAMALLLADRGEVARAVELYALASRYPHVANSRWFEDVAGKHIAAVAATLPPDVVAAAQERGRARDLWATAEELLAELEEEHPVRTNELH
jgi:tetratricopeptide (TPR) repeat protein